MLQRVMKHEWRLLTAERTAWVVVALFAVAIAAGVYNGARWVRFQKETINQLTQEERTRLDGILAQARNAELPTAANQPGAADQWDPRHPYYLGNTRGQRYAYLPPAALGVTAIGQSDLHPWYFKVSTDLKQNFANNYELENPLKLLAGRFDLAFVILYLYPLLILALSFNLLSGERERGTLALLLSQPVKLRDVVLGKAGVHLLIALLSVLIFATVGLLLAGVPLHTGAALAHFALWALAVIAYGAFWFGLALLVNARGQSSATNAMVLAAAWLLFVVLLPSAANALATTLYPTPSRVEYIQTLRAASDGEAGERSRLMAAFYEDHPELARGNSVSRREEFALTKEQLNQRTEAALRPLNLRFAAQLARQQSFVNRFRFLSPALLLQETLYDVAGAGQARHRHFMTTVDDFHRAWKDYFYPRIARRQLISSNEFAQLPRYEYREESTSAVWRRAAVPLLSALAVALLLIAFSLRAYRRPQLFR